tara:strand:+ start:470 stop:991 length:522 start_codon:yes stop_codon:yes gene_type:complete
MNGIRKLNEDNSKNLMIHPIFLTIVDQHEVKTKPIIPRMKNNMIIIELDKDKVKTNQIAKYAEKPYTSINSQLILDLKKISNLVDIEIMLDNKSFKTDYEFRYYLNLFIRLKLDKMSNIQINLLEEFLIKYFKKNNQSLNIKKIKNIIKKWKEMEKPKFEYNFIEYVENNIEK